MHHDIDVSIADKHDCTSYLQTVNICFIILATKSDRNILHTSYEKILSGKSTEFLAISNGIKAHNRAANNMDFQIAG